MYVERLESCVVMERRYVILVVRPNLGDMVVVVDGRLVCSCLMLAPEAEGKKKEKKTCVNVSKSER